MIQENYDLEDTFIFQLDSDSKHAAKAAQRWLTARSGRVKAQKANGEYVAGFGKGLLVLDPRAA